MLRCIIYMACCLGLGAGARADPLTWRADNTSIVFGGVDGHQPWNLSVAATANGEIFVEEVGHFRLAFSTETGAGGWLAGETECIELGSSIAQVNTILSTLQMKTEEGKTYLLSSIIPSISVKKSGNGKIESNYTISFEVIFDSTTAYSLAVELSLEGCSPLRTVGRWDDPGNWMQGIVPNTSSAVLFPASSGVATLAADTALQELRMLGGRIVAQTSGCAPGWSPFMLGNDG
jgi:hypothetical protein